MKSLKMFALIFSISVISFSCGSDDDNQNSSANKLVFGSTEYQLKAGTIEDYGLYSEGIYNFDIVLISSTISNVNGEPVPADDTFSGVYFELFTDNAANLEVGTYSFGNNVQVGSYTYADVMINATINDSGDENVFNISSGTFKVLGNGSTYEFEFEGTVNGGTSFSGYYKGTLQPYDYSDEVVIGDRPYVSNSKMIRKPKKK